MIKFNHFQAAMMALLLPIAMVTNQSVNYVNLAEHTPFKLSQMAFRQFYLANTIEFLAMQKCFDIPPLLCQICPE